MNKDFKNFALGGYAGSIGAFCVFPIDMVKTRMQNQINMKQKLYNNSFDCFKKIVRSEGIRGLYRGCLPNVVCVFPEKALKITINNFFIDKFKDNNNNVEFPLRLLAGGLGGAGQVIVTNPMEIIKIQMQMNSLTKLNNNSIFNVVRSLGLKNLYKGSSSCLMRDIPFSFIYFPLYDYLKSEKNLNNYFSGMVAGGTSAFTTTPLDVVKTRIQTTRVDDVKYKNLIDCFSKIYKNEGITAFYKGSGVRTLRSSIQFGITFAVFEKLSELC